MDDLLDTSQKTPRNIPACRFIENVEDFVGTREPVSVEDKLRELLMKYNYMDRSLKAQLASPRSKIPDIRDALQVVKFLKEKKGEPFETHFNLADIIYAKASIPSTDRVCLWLGSNTMLEYTLDEADDILEKNLKIAEDTIESVNKDLEWLRVQITIAEVNIARVHNFAVRKRKESRGAEAAAA